MLLLAKRFFTSIVILFCALLHTSAYAKITYTLNLDGVVPAIAAELTQSAKEAVAIYNQHGDIDKHVWVNYNANVATANANAEGWMVFGGQRNTRVMLHEIAHTLGVGTHAQYHALMQDGRWQGAVVNALLAEYDANSTGLQGDRNHMWPYGLNYDGDASPTNFIRHVEVVEALRCDMGIGPCKTRAMQKPLSPLFIPLDINTASNKTEAAYYPLLAEPNSRATVAGVSFTLFGYPEGNSEDIETASNLLTDFAASDGADAKIGLRIQHLPAGRYEVESWHYDNGEQGNVRVTYGPDGEVGQTLLANHAFSASAPARYIIESDGKHDYALVFNTVGDAHRACLNGILLTPFAVDIDVNTDSSETEGGYVPLLAESNATVNVKGIQLTLSGYQSVTERETGARLLRDFALSDGEGASIDVLIEGLPAGRYEVSSWHYDGYDLAGSVQVSFGALNAPAKTVKATHMFSAKQPARYTIETDGTSRYVLQFSGVGDENRTPLNGLSITSAARPDILREWWTAASGETIKDLTGLPTFPNRPNGAQALALFEGPTDVTDWYGSRISGVLYAPVTGDYTFYIAGDNAAELWMSTDANPDNKRLIAHAPYWTNARQWDRYPQQKSAMVTLQAGQAYYIEALQKEGGGNDNIAVAWQQPDTTEIEVLRNQYFKQPVKASNNPPVITLDQPMTASVSNTKGYIEATASDTDGSVRKVVFYYAGKAIYTAESAPYRLYWDNVADGSYSISTKAYDNKGDVAESNAVTIVIDRSAVDDNLRPTVALTQPVANAGNKTGYMTANATDADGTIARVEFYYGRTLLKSTSTAPYRLDWTNAPAGEYSITAKAYDNVGAVTTSVPVIIRVQ